MDPLPYPETMTDFGAVYATTRDELIAQLGALSSDDAATAVPGCPDWSAKDVVAHLSGLVADLLDGRKPPLGTPEMTSRQVGERADKSLAEVCAEWSANGDGIAALMAETPRMGMVLTGDLAVHFDDLAESVETLSTVPAEALAVACESYVPRLQERLAERLDIALTVTLDDQTWEPGAGAKPMTLTGGRSDFLRGLTGRRTRADVERTLTWDGDATAILDDAFLQYGPYRS